VLAASSPADCFDAAIEAVRIAVRYMTPVILLSDGYIANGSEPWKLPEVDDLPDLRVDFRTDAEGFLPYLRDPETSRGRGRSPARRASSTASAGSRRQDAPATSATTRTTTSTWSALRAEKVARIAQDIPPLEVDGAPTGGELLVLGWGSHLRRDHRAVRQQALQGRRT
jgi:2-oxoglutarate/2-oxoacid ferredoxin oxidoreductase subunit alpha